MGISGSLMVVSLEDDPPLRGTELSLIVVSLEDDPCDSLELDSLEVELDEDSLEVELDEDSLEVELDEDSLELEPPLVGTELSLMDVVLVELEEELVVVVV